jgi:hypothetical protein
LAKDGTNRGGRRIRAGDKPQPLSDKIINGKIAKILEVPELNPESIINIDDPEGVSELLGEDMPAPSDYLSARQKDGKALGADVLFIETWRWLRAAVAKSLLTHV